MKRKWEVFKQEANPDQEETISSFFKAMEQNKVKIVKEMLSERPELIHESYLDCGVLTYALSKKRYCIAKHLIKIGADVNSVSSRGKSILQQALSSRANNLVIAILEREELNITEGYYINNFLLYKSPALLAESLFMMILKSQKSLKSLLCKDSFDKLSSSSKFIESLRKLFKQNALSAEQQEVMFLAIKELEEVNEELEERTSAEINIKKLDDEEEHDDPEIVSILKQSIDSYAEIREPLIAAVRAQGYELREVPRDGDCFFSALARSIFKNIPSDALSEIAALYRAEAVNYMLVNNIDFIYFFRSACDFYWYMDVLELRGMEVDGIIIQALSDSCGSSFIIHNGDNIYAVRPRGITLDAEIHIFYDGRHYEGLLYIENDIRIDYRLFQDATNPSDVENPLVVNIITGGADLVDDLLAGYEELFAEEWFLNSIESLPEDWLDRVPSEVQQNESYYVMTGLLALYLFIPDKFEGHI